MINNTYSINQYLAVLIFMLFSFSYSQNTISRVDFEIVNNDKVEMFIYYTLTPEDPKDFYFIDLKISSDSGDNWFSPKSIRGDIDSQSGYGKRKIIWDIFSDIEELEGDIRVKVIATKKLTFKDKMQKFQTISDEKSAYTNGFYLLLAGSETTFGDSTFQNNIDNGIISRGSAFDNELPSFGIGFRLQQLPYIFHSGFQLERFHGHINDLNFSLSHFNVEFSASRSFLSDILDIVTPYVGAGYQFSFLSMDSLYTNDSLAYQGCSTYDSLYYDCDYDTHTYTSDLFVNLGVIFEFNYVQLGIRNKISLFRREKPWDEIQVSIGFKVAL